MAQQVPVELNQHNINELLYSLPASSHRVALQHPLRVSDLDALDEGEPRLTRKKVQPRRFQGQLTEEHIFQQPARLEQQPQPQQQQHQQEQEQPWLQQQHKPQQQLQCPSLLKTFGQQVSSCIPVLPSTSFLCVLASYQH